MAIIKEHPYIQDGVEKANMVRHYSDCGKKILQKETGAVYSETVDVYPCKYTYEETGEMVEDYTPEDGGYVSLENAVTVEELTAAYNEGVNSL